MELFSTSERFTYGVPLSLSEAGILKSARSKGFEKAESGFIASAISEPSGHWILRLIRVSVTC